MCVGEFGEVNSELTQAVHHLYKKERMQYGITTQDNFTSQATDLYCTAKC